jgi:hypothetical protein
MKLAGHASFETTHKYCLKVSDGLVDRARKANAQAMSHSGTLWHALPPSGDMREGRSTLNGCDAGVCIETHDNA